MGRTFAACPAGGYNAHVSRATPAPNVLRSSPAARPLPVSPGVLERAALIVILLVATFLRTHLPLAAPPGLQHDEVFKANFAQEILDGQRPAFFDANGGEEALFPYLAAVSILIFGQNFFALRMVSLFCGLLSLALGYSLTKLMFGRNVAIVTTALLSVSFWHVFDTRVALRPITLLLMAVASFYLFWLGLRRGGMARFALAGVFLGGSFYTYTSGLLIPLTVVIFVLLYLLPFRRGLLQQRWKGILLALAVALILCLPMAYHVYAHPIASTARARDLGDHVALLLSGEPGPMVRDVLSVAAMFGLRGDPEWRYNLPGRPVFDPLTFLLFCGGLAICLTRIRRPEYAFLLLWLPVNLIPSAVTRNSPSTLRAIGSLTAIYMLPAIAVGFAWLRVRRRYGTRGTAALCAAVALLVIGNGVLTYRDYFQVWARNSEVRDIYRGDLTAAAQFIDGLPEDELVCVSASFAEDLDQQVLTFMLGERRPIRWFDGRQALVFPELGSSSEVVYVIPATGPLHQELARRFLSEIAVSEQVLDPTGEPALVTYRLGAQELSSLRATKPAYELSVDLEGKVELLGYELPLSVEAGSEVPLLVYWRVPEPIRPDLRYSFFAHLVDMRGYVWDQIDTMGYPVSNWIRGDQVVQLFDLKVPIDAPPVEYQVKVGMYDEVTAVRLTPTVMGAPQPEGLVSTAAFSVRRAPAQPLPSDLDIPRERYASFDGALTLLGGDVGPPAVERGEPVRISLYWQAEERPREDYVVSVILTTESGEMLDEILREPVDGLYPATLWSKGEIVRDRFDWVLDPGVPEGRHRLWVRLWDPGTREYLFLSGSREDRVRLGKVYVVP
jgi:4-amino-4-deoxy-L-arabinose transferase-like glycosyltransferase